MKESPGSRTGKILNVTTLQRTGESRLVSANNVRYVASFGLNAGVAKGTACPRETLDFFKRMLQQIVMIRSET